MRIVLSLFDGMSTLHQALRNQNIQCTTYYASEIKKHAIDLTQHHSPDTIQLGDIRGWKDWDIDWSQVDLIGSGSPCKNISRAGNREGIVEGNESKLFFTFIDILDHIRKHNPSVLFLQENVASASQVDINIISRALGVTPILIDSALVTAQTRKRYYWTNIRTRRDGLFHDLTVDIPQPKDRKILLKDIITDGIADRDKARTILESESRNNTDKEKFLRRYFAKRFGNLIFLREGKPRVYTNTKKGSTGISLHDVIDLGFPSSKTRRGRVMRNKSHTLVQTDNKLHVYTGDDIRPLNKTELCRLQGFTDSYCDSLTRNKAASLLGDGWTLPVIEHILSFIEGDKR